MNTPSFIKRRRGNAYPGSFAATYNALDFGLYGDGIHDDSKALSSLIAIVFGNGGGIIHFPAGTYLLSSPIIFPFSLAHPLNSDNLPYQKYIRFTGDGHSFQGYWTVVNPPPCTILDLRYDGSDNAYPAKINTLGAGVFEFDHVMFKSGGTDNLLFINATNTTIMAHDYAVWGNDNHGGQTCVQDFIRLGGNATLQSDNVNASFQGYGTHIRDSFYHKIQRGIIFGNHCNGIQVTNETYSKTCGSPDAHGSPYLFSVDSADNAAGNRIIGGTVEITNYKHLVNFNGNNSQNALIAIGIYDDQAYFESPVYCSATANYNWAIAGYLNPTVQQNVGYFSGVGASTNSVFSGGRYLFTNLPQGFKSSTVDLVSIKSNTLLSSVSTGTPSGTHMTVDTGTGGSYWNNKAYSQRFMDHNGNIMAEIRSGQAKGAVKVGNAVTGSRPTPANAGIGGIFYDTTLSKPIFSDGTTWRDAAGNAV